MIIRLVIEEKEANEYASDIAEALTTQFVGVWIDAPEIGYCVPQDVEDDEHEREMVITVSAPRVRFTWVGPFDEFNRSAPEPPEPAFREDEE